MDRDNKQDRISEVIGLIYDAAQNPELWPKLLGELDELSKNDNTLVQEGNSKTLVPNRSSRFALLRPHFKRAMHLNQTIYSLKTELEAVSSILDRMPIGIILINKNLIPVAINYHARQAIQSGNSLILRDGKLSTRYPKDNQKFTAMVEQAITRHELNQSLLEQSLQLTSENGDPYSLWIAPSASAGIKHEHDLAAVFIASAEIRHAISPESLMPMYHLTNAEAHLLHEMISNVNSLNEAADKLDVSKHTVRTQMKAIFEKTGTHSQTELIKKVLGNPAILMNKEHKTKLITSIDTLSLNQVNTPADPEGQLRLHDGRKLEYFEFGDPDGIPVLYFHGIVHAKSKFHPSSTYAEDNGIRIIAPERPGFGNSDSQQARSLTNYMNDIEELLEKRNIDRFYVLGDGDGGPAALATACHFGQRVHKAAVIGCMPEPRFEALENILPFDLKLQRLADAVPKSVIYGLCRIILKGVKLKNTYFELMYKDFPDSDIAIITSEEHKKLFSECMSNLTGNNMDGFIDDYFCRKFPWDFKVEDIKAKVDLWHGVHDPFSNIDSAKKIMAALPQCQPHILEGHGHYLFISHLDEILAALFE